MLNTIQTRHMGQIEPKSVCFLYSTSQRRCRGWAALLFLFLLVISLSANGQSPKTYRVQLGVFHTSDQALTFVEKVKRVTGRPVYADYLQETFIVTAGDFETPEDAKAFLNEMKKHGYPEAIVVEVLKTVREQRTLYPIHHIQIDNYTSRQRAEEVAAELLKRNLHPVETLNQGSYFTVRVGQYRELEQANEIMHDLRRSGYPYCWLVQTNRTRTWTETDVFAIRSLETPGEATDRLDPARLSEGQLVQVVVGPFDQLGVARDTFQILEVEKFPPLRLVRTDRGLEIEVKEPREYDFATTLLDNLQEKGFREVFIREKIPVRVLEEKPDPDTREAPRETPIARPTEPTLEDQVREKILQAHTLLEQGDIQEARDLFAVALGVAPTNEQAIQGMAETKRLLELKDNLKKRLTEARYLVKNDELHRARQRYAEIIAEYPDHEAARRELDALEDEIGAPSVVALPDTTPVRQPPPTTRKPKTAAPPQTGAPWSWIGMGAILVGGIGALVFVKKRKAMRPSEHLQEAPTPPETSPQASPPIQQPTQPESLDTTPMEDSSIPDSIKKSETESVTTSPESIYEEQIEDELQLPKTLAQEQQPTITPVESSTDQKEFSADPPATTESADSSVVFEQNYLKYTDGASPLDWQGIYDQAKLVAVQSPDISVSKPCLAFRKSPSDEEVLFCAMLPDAGRNPVFEFEIGCREVVGGPVGLYLESVENEAISIGITFVPGSTPDSLQLQLGSFSVNTEPGQWHLVRIEASLDKPCYSLALDGKTLDEARPIDSDVENLDILCLKAGPETWAELLLASIRVEKA